MIQTKHAEAFHRTTPYLGSPCRRRYGSQGIPAGPNGGSRRNMRKHSTEPHLIWGPPVGDGTGPVGSCRIPTEDPDETAEASHRNHFIWGTPAGDGTDPVRSCRIPMNDPDGTCGSILQNHTLFGVPLPATARIPGDLVGSQWRIQAKRAEAPHKTTP